MLNFSLINFPVASSTFDSQSIYSTVSCIATTRINIMFHELAYLIKWPKIKQVKKNRLKEFKYFPHTRVIIDCLDYFYKDLVYLAYNGKTWSIATKLDIDGYRTKQNWNRDALTKFAPFGTDDTPDNLVRVVGGKVIVVDKNIEATRKLNSLNESGSNNCYDLDIRSPSREDYKSPTQIPPLPGYEESSRTFKSPLAILPPIKKDVIHMLPPDRRTFLSQRESSSPHILYSGYLLEVDRYLANIPGLLPEKPIRLTIAEELEVRRRIARDLCDVSAEQLQPIYLELVELDPRLTGYIHFTEMGLVFLKSEVKPIMQHLRLVAAMFVSESCQNYVNYEKVLLFISKSLASKPSEMKYHDPWMEHRGSRMKDNIPELHTRDDDESSKNQFEMENRYEEGNSFDRLVQETEKRLSNMKGIRNKPWMERFLVMAQAFYDCDFEKNGYLKSSEAVWLAKQYSDAFQLGLSNSYIQKSAACDVDSTPLSNSYIQKSAACDVDSTPKYATNKYVSIKNMLRILSRSN